MRITISGANGRMGKVLIKAVNAHPKLTLAGALVEPNSPDIGRDSGEISGMPANGIVCTDNIDTALKDADGVIDFTIPEATIHLVHATSKRSLVHIIGTTGLSEAQENIVQAAGHKARIVKSGNMSLGVNLLAAVTKQVATALDEDFDIEVLEMHHRHKVDAPSGTAYLLGQAAAEGRVVSLKEKAVLSREGITGERNSGDIGFATLRGGSVVGDHSVIFAGNSERITLSHHAEDRAIFANGALKAAIWAMDKPAGFYSMLDVLGIE